MQKSSLTALARQQLELAHTAASGRGSSTVYGGHERHGRVRLGTSETSWDGSSGDLLIVPDCRHTLEALEDAAVLLTVAKHL